MTDPRLIPSNGRVAHISLEGQVSAKRFVEGEVRLAVGATCDLCSKPKGNRSRQLVRGEAFRILDLDGVWTFGQSVSDGYVGWTMGIFGDLQAPTHWVKAPRAVALEHPDVTAQGAAWMLSFGSRIRHWPHSNADQEAAWSAAGWTRILREDHAATPYFMRSTQLEAIGQTLPDPAGIAETFLHTPYLWGGDTGFGLDCSGLVQRCLMACGIPCPRDSDQQEAAFPEITEADLSRGDLIFWKGHVGMMLDDTRLIHANAHHMAVATEPLTEAVARIAQKEFGAVTSLRRPMRSSLDGE